MGEDLKPGDIVVQRSAADTIALAIRQNFEPSMLVGVVNKNGAVHVIHQSTIISRHKSWVILPPEFHDILVTPEILACSERLKSPALPEA